MQDYSKFRFIIIDDGSSDETGKELDEFLKLPDTRKIIYKLIIDKERMYSLRNIRSAAKDFCLPE